MNLCSFVWSARWRLSPKVPQEWTCIDFWSRAVNTGSLEEVEELLRQGADVNQKRRGETALLRAARNDDEDMVRLLLAWGADVNQTDEIGQTALSEARHNNNADIVALLKAAGAEELEDRNNLQG